MTRVASYDKSSILRQEHMCGFSRQHMCGFSRQHMCGPSRQHMCGLSRQHMCGFSRQHMCGFSRKHMLGLPRTSKISSFGHECGRHGSPRAHIEGQRSHGVREGFEIPPGLPGYHKKNKNGRQSPKIQKHRGLPYIPI